MVEKIESVVSIVKGPIERIQKPEEKAKARKSISPPNSPMSARSDSSSSSSRETPIKRKRSSSTSSDENGKLVKDERKEVAP